MSVTIERAAPGRLRVDETFRASLPPPANLMGIRESMRQRGVLVPLLVTEDDLVLDGHTRLGLARELGLEYVPIYRLPFRSDECSWLRTFAMAVNVYRRHLTEGQLVALGNSMLRVEQAAAKERQREGGKKGGGDRRSPDRTGSATADANPIDKASARVGAQLGLSARTVERAQAVLDRSPELGAKLARGEITVSAASRELKRVEVRERLDEVAARHAEEPTGEYDVLVVDPPWPIEKIERDVRPNQVELDYPAMTLEEIKALDVPAADDAHLWLWTTHRFLPAAFDVLAAWQFKYVCTFVWKKPGGFQPIGLPQLNCEFALYARRGTPSFVDTKALSVCFDAPRGGHSEKPEGFYEVLRRVTGGRRIDMFNRRTIDGFDRWGKEAA